jgi:3-phosphoshikimate 1-carboxyvinyltransferase
MIYSCTPIEQPFRSTIEVPGSKSVANRALICAALSSGTSTLTNLPSGDDTEAMLTALCDLGLTVERTGTGVEITRRQPLQSAGLDAGLAGTTSRFLTALVATGDSEIQIDGRERLRQRPFGPLINALRSLGADIQDSNGGLPLTIHGPLRGGTLQVDATMSSQFISSLMMVGPTLDGGLKMSLLGELISRPYVELTALVMKMFGVHVELSSTQIVISEQSYTAAEVNIEADASSASYPLAIAAATGSTVTIEGFGTTSHQGDVFIVEILKMMGATVLSSESTTTVSRDGDSPLSGVDIDMSEVSDLVPTVAALACLANTATRIRGVGFIRAKESDRIGDLAHELRKFGAQIEEHDDGLSVLPSTLHGAAVDTHDDHRLAMAFSIVGSCIPGVEIHDAGVVSKSWPTYWDDLAAMTC